MWLGFQATIKDTPCACLGVGLDLDVNSPVFTLAKSAKPPPSPLDHLVGLVVKVSASRAEDPGFESRFPWDFFRVESYQ